jgi:formamidopyrimidine-DNA glycosylase
MPEIAEVRTVAKVLRKNIVGRTIKDIKYRYDGIIKTDKDEFKNILIGRTITDLDTFGKWIIIKLDDYTILSHLRMEGKYYIKDKNEEYEKHEHIIFTLDNGKDLRYKDVRKFGVMMLVKTKDIYNTPEISKLGLEPDDDHLTKEYIYNKIHKSNKPIKELLLDQAIINGLGNIYVDEVLFASNIRPTRLGNKVTLKECDNIKISSNNIITKATECGGTTIRSYTSSLGVEGTYQEYLKVHTKNNKPCPICGTIIEKIRVGGRGTYYCKKCQK